MRGLRRGIRMSQEFWVGLGIGIPFGFAFLAVIVSVNSTGTAGGRVHRRMMGDTPCWCGDDHLHGKVPAPEPYPPTTCNITEGLHLPGCQDPGPPPEVPHNMLRSERKRGPFEIIEDFAVLETIDCAPISGYQPQGIGKRPLQPPRVRPESIEKPTVIREGLHKKGGLNRGPTTPPPPPPTKLPPRGNS